MTNASHTQEPIDVLREHIKDIRMVMLSTISDGRIVARPMSMQEMGPTGTIWFLTSADSNKVKEIAQNPTVGLAFTDSGAETYVSVSGTATVTNDREQIKEFWNPLLNAWFEGPDDPIIRVIEITPISAEYWITKGGKIVSLVSAVLSAVTGKDMEAGENAEITL